MATFGWMINLTGNKIPVYTADGSGPILPQLGNLTKNECFIDGTISENPFEGDGYPVIFLNANHEFKFGLVKDEDCGNGLVDFTDYASNGTSWVQVDTLERKVQYATRAYYADGSLCCELPANSRVWLTQNGGAGSSNHNYIAVTKVQTASGKTYTFKGNGFVDLTYGNRWVNVGSILLRKV